MGHLSFTRAQAQAKIGKRVLPRVTYAGVPQGAVRTIVRVDRVIDGYNVEVAWVWSGLHTPWVD